ncbi:T9SS type A sorting domain-containing protein, partial [Hymenobacter agri]
VATRLAYFDVVGRLTDARLGPGQTPAPADSAALRQLSLGNSAEAEGATGWLQYYYPQLSVPRLRPLRSSDTPVVAAGTATRALRIYPNPATNQVSLIYASKTGETAEVYFFDLMTGKTLHRVSLSPTEAAGEQQAPVSLSDLPAGTYGCRILVGGQPRATQRLVIQ